MGLFKKKEKVQSVETSSKEQREAEVINTSAVADSGRKASSGYNWTNVRCLKKWQIGLIIGCVVFLLGTLFVTGSINGSRQSQLNAVVNEIRALQNEKATLESTVGAVDETIQTKDSYHNYEQQSIDDTRMTELLNSLLRWKTGDERTAKQSEAAGLPNVQNSFLALLFSVNIESAGYTYNADKTQVTETPAISNFTSYMTTMANKSRTYNALMDFTYNSVDGKVYTKMIFMTYTVYDNVTGNGSVGNMSAYDVMLGTKNENIIVMPGETETATPDATASPNAATSSDVTASSDTTTTSEGTEGVSE